MDEDGEAQDGERKRNSENTIDHKERYYMYKYLQTVDYCRNPF